MRRLTAAVRLARVSQQALQQAHTRTVHSSALAAASGQWFSASRGVEDAPVISLGRTSTVPHVGFAIVPQQTQMVVERLGRFSRVLDPGLHFLIPLVDRIGYTWSLKEEAVPVKAQTAITRDNGARSRGAWLEGRLTRPLGSGYPD